MNDADVAALIIVAEVEFLDSWPHGLAAGFAVDGLRAWRAGLEHGEELAAEGLVLAAVAWR